MAGSALRELLAIFDIAVNDEELKKGHKTVEGFKGKLEEVGKKVAEAFAVYEVGEFIESTIEAGARLGDLSERLGVATDDLQAFQYAAKLGGVDSEAAAHSLGFLNKAVGEALGGSKEAVGAFAKLGVAFRDSHGDARELGDIIGDVADGIAGLPSQQERAAYAMKLFGREGQALLPVLQGGGEELGKLREEFERLGGGASEEFVHQAKELDDELAKVKFGLNSLRNTLVAEITPALIVVTRWVKTKVEALIELVKHSKILQASLAALAGFLAGKFVLVLLDVAETLGILKATALETIAALWEFALPIAAVAALIWVIQDLWSLMEGGDSTIGMALDKFFGVGTAAKLVGLLRESWVALIEVVNSAAYAVGYFLGVLSGFAKMGLGADDNELERFFLRAIEAIVAATRLLVGFLQVLTAIPAAIKSGDWSKLGKIVDKAGDSVFGKGGLFDASQTDADKQTQYGLPPEATELWLKMQADQAAGRGVTQSGGDYGEGANASFDNRPRLKLPGHGAAAGEGASHHVEQNVVNHVTVKTSSDQPKAVGDAVGAGVASATEKDLRNAMSSVSSP